MALRSFILLIAVCGAALAAAGVLAVCLVAEKRRGKRDRASLTARLDDLSEGSSRQIQAFARIGAIIASSQQRDQLLSQIIFVLCDYFPECAVRLLVYHKDGSLERIGSTLAQSSLARAGGGSAGPKPNDENLMNLIAVPSGGKRSREWDLFLDDDARLDFAYDFPFIAEEEFKGALVVTARKELGERERLFLGDIATLIASAHQYVLTADQKDAINEQFGKSVDPKVRDHLLSAKEAGAMLDVSVLFLDVRNFTTRSELLGPVETVRFLNVLFESCDAIVREEGGFINKFTGDGFMAVFGAPERNDTHPSDAVRAARRILEKLGDVSVGIGVASGQALAGTIGSERRREYTVIGDTVNIASRVEGLCKVFGAELMVTGETFARSANDAGDSRYLGKVRLKGKERAIDVYELRNDGAKSGECWDGEFARAIQGYFKADFVAAERAFSTLAERYPKDKAIAWYSARSAERATQGAREWDGVEQMTSK